MPRKPRLRVPGGVYHVILRGNNRQALFHSDADRCGLETLIAKGLIRYWCWVHAYCWMTNHLHLAVQVADQSLLSFVQYVSSRYARRFTHCYGRTGYLFERRHRALLVDDETYLLMLVRYIHQNPVEAGLVSRATSYRWCSHRTYLVDSTRPG
jgi:REP element-mobilizing transposase RayT